MNYDNYSTIKAEAQAWLFKLECEGHQLRKEIVDYVDSVRVEVYALLNTTIYFFVDIATGEQFRTRNFNDAVGALVYAVS